MASKNGVYSTFAPPTSCSSIHAVYTLTQALPNPPHPVHVFPSMTSHLGTHLPNHYQAHNARVFPPPHGMSNPKAAITPTKAPQSTSAGKPTPPSLLPLPNPYPQHHSHAPSQWNPHHRGRPRHGPRIQRDTRRDKRRRGDYPRRKRRVNDGRNTRKGRRLRCSVGLDGSRGVLRVEDAAYVSI